MNLTKFKNVFLLSMFITSGSVVSAGIKHPATGEAPHSTRKDGLQFIENKGQWDARAKYMAEIPGGNMFVSDKGFMYDYTSQQDLDKMHEESEAGKDASQNIIHHHAFMVNFVGANANIKYTSSQKSETYHNYFIGNDPTKWASKVGLFGKVNQQNVYNGIDVNIYSKGTSPKYDFVVAAGADVSQIKLSFGGNVQTTLDANGDLKIKTTVNEIVEKAPYSYQVINGVEKQVASKYKLKDGILSFEITENYDHSQPLIIDPILVFATYSGGTGGAYYAYSTTYDQLGNMYTAAYTSASGWPVTSQAYQSTVSTNGCPCINKYNASGSSLVYSTYFGGNGSTWANAMRVTSNNELVIVGSTSASNLPTTTGAYQPALSGGNDFYLTKFSVDGATLLACTYVGGTASDGNLLDIYNATSPSAQSGLSASGITSPWELDFDSQNNAWVVGNTSSTDFPVTTGAFQSTFGGGSSDGVVFKLNASCTQLLYSSFFGGSSNDALYGLGLLSNGNVAVVGGTQSTNITTTTGTLHTTSQGGWDGYLAIINPAQTTLVASTYLGTSGDDNGTKLQIDGNNNIYVLGRTALNGTYPVSTGVFSIPGGDVYVDKINPTLTASLYSTRLGATGTTRYLPNGFLLDLCQNVYVTGLTPNAATSGLPTTPDAFDPNAKAFYFCVLEPNFSGLLFGSYYGIGSGDHPHCGTSRLDPQGIVYSSFCSASTGFTGTAGSWSPNKLNSSNDNFSFKFNFEATGVSSNFVLDPAVSGNDSGCAPYSVHFINTSTTAHNYVWNFGDGSPTTTTAQPTHVFTTPGIYNVSLHAINDSACITDDTSYMTITVLQTTPPIISVHDTILCSFQQTIPINVTISNPSPNNTIQWGPGAGITGPSNTAQVTVDPSINNVYYVIVKDTIPHICGFSKTDTVHIDLRPRILDIVNNDTVVCEGTVVPITAVSTAGYTYRWTPTTGVSDSTALQPNITINQPNFYTLTGSYPGCTDTSVTINIGMQYIPHLTVSEDKYVCQWTDVALESNVTPFRNDYIYQWTPATPNLTNPTGPNTHLIADTSITYYLHVATPIGCSDDDTVNVTVFPGNFGGITADTGYCAGTNGSVPLVATGGTTYTWTPAYGLSDPNIGNPIASPTESTDYTVLIQDIHNCLDTQKVSVAVYPAPIINMPDSVNIYSGETYHLQPATNCLYFAWFPPSGLDNPNISDPTMSPTVRTRYYVNATTEHGCAIKDSIDILVQETVIDMPNAFAPGGGNNNLFKPAHRGIAQLNSFNIFDRWGKKVYSSINLDEGWDGTYNGKPQPLGVYVYTIDAVTDSGKRFVKQGSVTLIR